jgi:hypothetical protein
MRGGRSVGGQGKSDGWSMRKAKSKRLNDDVAVVEITLPVQSSAGGERRKR